MSILKLDDMFSNEYSKTTRPELTYKKIEEVVKQKNTKYHCTVVANGIMQRLNIGKENTNFITYFDNQHLTQKTDFDTICNWVYFQNPNLDHSEKRLVDEYTNKFEKILFDLFM
ncbi:MAG: hypothetical protein QM479_14510 [Pseudomonadota bacterium]